MTIQDVIKANGGKVSGQTTAQSSSNTKKNSSPLDEIISQGRAAADKQLAEQSRTTTTLAPKSTEETKPKTTTTKDDESWIKKVARYIDENTSNDADVTFGYGSLPKGKQTLTETVDKAKAKNEQTRKENTAAAATLRKEQKADAGGTTFGEDRKKTDGKNMKWWEKLNAEAANAADATYGTYSPGNATGRTKVGNTVASGLQDAGSSVAEATGFVTDQKGDKEPTLAEITYGDDKVQVLPFMKKFWQKISDAAYKQSDKMAEEAEKSKTIAKDGAGTVGSFLVDAGSAATQMGADIAVSGVTGINGLIPMAIRSFGGGLREARQDGASKQEQFNYAVGSAAMEVLTEKLGSVTLPFKSTYGKGAVDDLVENLIKESAKTEMGAAALSTLFSAMSEGGEEILSDVVNPILKTIAYDPNAYKEYGTAEYWSNLLRDGLLGAGLGLAGGGGQIVSAARNTVANRGNAEVETEAPQVEQPLTPVDAVVQTAQGVNEKSKLNIDNTTNSVYTQDANGGAIDATENQLYRNADAGVWNGQDGSIPNLQMENGGELRRGNIQPIGVVLLSQQSKDAINQSGVVFTEVQDASADATAFSNALNNARLADSRNGWAVTYKSPEEIAENNVKVYMDSNQSVGFGIAPDGDIEAVFANKSAGAPKGSTKSILPQAIAAGGKKLDCYGSKLVDIYSQFGFVPVARVEFNEEYANDGWDESKGKPYIYFMMHNGDSADAVVNNMGNYHSYTEEELNALPTYGKEDYDSAFQYRDNLLNQQSPMQAEMMDDEDLRYSSVGAATAGFEGEMTPGQKWVAEAQGIGDSALHPISAEQDANLAEQQGRAAQEIPKVDLKGHLTSKSVSTIANSGVTPTEMSDAILEDAAQGKFSHIEYTDAQAMSVAEQKILANGWEQELGAYRADVMAGKVSKDITAMGITLYNNAVTNNDFTTAMDIIALMTKNSTTMAQGLQAMRILNKLSPDGRLYAAVKSVEYMAEDLKAKYGLEDDIEIDPDLLSDYRDALESGDKSAIRDAWGAVQQNIADQIPPTWRDKLDAWRYLAMLGNARTHIRNIIGNAGFAPVRTVKNVLATGIEAAVDKVSGGKIDRTKALLTTSASDKALIATAWASYENASEAIMSGGKFNDLPNEINDRRTIFKFKPLDKAQKFNSNALNAEDKWFSQPAYAFALASYLKANNITAQEFASDSFDEGKRTKAMEYAVKEAQKATYRDTNALSKAVSKLRVKPAAEDASAFAKGLNTAGKVLVEGLMPFKKTPANILARAIEYSPAGLTAYLTVGSAQVAKGKMTAAEFIDGLASGLTGTGILGLGVYFAAQGLLSGGGKDNDELDKLQGIQNYSLNVGGKSITVDWLAPEALPLFVGVELWQSMLDKDENASFVDFIKSLENITEPMLDMSMLQGVNDLLDSLSYSDYNISTILKQLTTSYISQFFPTLFGQGERAFLEDTRQSTFIDKNSELQGDTQSFLGKLFNKIPGVEYQQMDYLDAWGRTQESGSLAERMFNNLVNPAYVNDIKVESVENELRKLVDAGYTEVMPKRATSSTQIEGEYMTQEQFETYAKAKGQTSLETVNRLVNSTAYRNMNDADKAAAIKSAYDYAEGIAKLKVKPTAEVESWITEAKNSNNPAQYIVDKSVMKNDVDGNGSTSQGEKILGLIKAGYSGAELTEKVKTYINDNEDGKLLTIMSNGQSAKVPDKTIAEVYDYYNNAHNIENGATKQEQVFDYIKGLNLDGSQKQALYYSLYKKLP